MVIKFDKSIESLLVVEDWYKILENVSIAVNNSKKLETIDIQCNDGTYYLSYDYNTQTIFLYSLIEDILEFDVLSGDLSVNNVRDNCLLIVNLLPALKAKEF